MVMYAFLYSAASAQLPMTHPVYGEFPYRTSGLHYADLYAHFMYVYLTFVEYFPAVITLQCMACFITEKTNFSLYVH